MENVLWAAVSAIIGVAVGLAIAGVRGKLHRDSVRTRHTPILQGLLRQYKDAMDGLVQAKNSGDPTQISLAHTQWMVLSTQLFMISLFLEAEGIRNPKVELPEIPWAADSDLGQ